jgi:hypothetical protein
MSGKLVGGLMVVVVFGAVAFALSPYWSIAGLATAAQAENTDAIADLVDFERLKQNLKGQIMTAADLAKASDEGGLAILGAALGTALVDKTIETMITPEVLAQAIKANLGGENQSRAEIAVALLRSGRGDWIDADTFRMTADKGLVFTWRRHGLVWRMTSMKPGTTSGNTSRSPVKAAPQK